MLNKIFYDSKSTQSFGNFYSDPLIIKKILPHISSLKSYAVRESQNEILDICLDIETAIEKCRFLQSQKERLGLWMAGYSEPDIAKIQNAHRVSVHNSIVRCSEKISEQLVKGYV